MHSDSSSREDLVKFQTLQGVFFCTYGIGTLSQKILFAKFCNRSGGSLNPVEYTRH